MARILVCYYSRTGHTKHMAEAVAEGIAQGGATADVRDVADTKASDLLDYEGIVLGSPTYYGTMAWQIKKLLDDSVQYHGQLAGKVAGAFTSSANVGGGNETTVLDLVKALLIHGMVAVGSSSGDHYGPVAIGDLDDRARKGCLKHGKLVGELAVKLHG